MILAGAWFSRRRGIASCLASRIPGKSSCADCKAARSRVVVAPVPGEKVKPATFERIDAASTRPSIAFNRSALALRGGRVVCTSRAYSLKK
jgi:hypothetical protein